MARGAGKDDMEKEKVHGTTGKKKKVKVYAFCDDVAASGGYWLACAADEIYANGASVVGSGSANVRYVKKVCVGIY